MDGVNNGITFKIFTPSAMKARVDDDNVMRLSGIASSTIRDRHGDTMQLSALEDMERSAVGMTIFGNHSYRVPEDVYGTVEKAFLKSDSIDQNGEPIYDLVLDIAVNDENQRAVDTFKAVKKNARLGLSIGAMIPDGGAIRDKSSGAYTISHVELLETSIVGVPANQRSWLDNAIKALRGNQPNEDTEAQEDAAPEAVTQAATPEIEASACSECGHGANCSCGCGSSTHKTVTPDKTDATVTVVVETDDSPSSQEAPASEPAESSAEEEGEKPEILDETADGDDELLGDDVTMSAQQIVAKAQSEGDLSPSLMETVGDLLALLNRSVEELEKSKEVERTALAAKADAEQQRDEAMEISANILAKAKSLLDRVGELPAGRRTGYYEAQKDFSNLEKVYSDDFLKMLRGKNTDE